MSTVPAARRWRGTLGGDVVSVAETFRPPAGMTGAALTSRPGRRRRSKAVWNLSATEATPPLLTFARSGDDLYLQVGDGTAVEARAADEWTGVYADDDTGSLWVCRGYANLLTDPLDPTTGAWSAGAGASATADQYAAPDGTTTGAQASCTSGNLGQYQAIAVADGTRYAASLWVRQGSGSPNPSAVQFLAADNGGTGNAIVYVGSAPASFTRHAGAFTATDNGPGVFVLTDGYNRNGNGAADRTVGTWGAQVAEAPADVPFTPGTVGATLLSVAGRRVVGPDGFFDLEFEALGSALAWDAFDDTKTIFTWSMTDAAGTWTVAAYVFDGDWTFDVSTPQGSRSVSVHVEFTGAVNVRAWSRLDSVGLTVDGVTDSASGDLPVAVPTTVWLLSDGDETPTFTFIGAAFGLCDSKAAPATRDAIDATSRWNLLHDTTAAVDRTTHRERDPFAQLRVTTGAKVLTVYYYSTMTTYPTQGAISWGVEGEGGYEASVAPDTFDAEASFEIVVPYAGTKTVVLSDGGQYLSGTTVKGTWITRVEADGRVLDVVHPAAPADRIAVYGDSIAAGFGATSLGSAWHTLLRVAFAGRVTLIGRGSWSLYQDVHVDGGGAVAALVARLAGALDGTGSNVLWIEQGFNDYYGPTGTGWTVGNGVGVAWTVAAFKAAYKALVQGVLAARPAATVYCAPTAVMATPATNAHGAYLADYVAAVADACAEIGAGATFVDVTDVGWYDATDLADFVHPGDTGHNKYALQLLATLGI